MEDNESTFIEFATRIAGRELTDFEKETFKTIYKCRKNGDRLFIIPARWQGRQFALSLIKIFEEEFT